MDEPGVTAKRWHTELGSWCRSGLRAQGGWNPAIAAVVVHAHQLARIAAARDIRRAEIDRDVHLAGIDGEVERPPSERTARAVESVAGMLVAVITPTRASQAAPEDG